MVGGIQYKTMNSAKNSKTPRYNNLSTSGLKSESRDWIRLALDPYHDYQVEPAGLPDERSAPSVLQVHNQTYNLTAPVQAGDSSNWDACVLYTGFNSLINAPSWGGMVTRDTSAGVEYSSAALSAGVPFGALNIWAGLSGSTMPTGAPIHADMTKTCLGSVLATDRCRLVGVAFEIHNTTSDLYKQGSLTVAQLPDCACDSATVPYIDTVGAGGNSYHVFQADRAMIQASQAQALMSVPGSTTWPARDGVYVIPRMTVVPRDVNTFGYNHLGLAGQAVANCRVPVLYGTDGKTALPEPTGKIDIGTNTLPGLNPCYCSGFCPIQVFLTGLSNQTTLTITFKTIVEYFPALGSPLLPLSHPSSEFDARALELYSAVITKIPYAVPVGENSAGDYFKRVLAVLGKAAQVMAPILVQAAPALGSFAPLADVVGRMMIKGGAAGPPPLPPRNRPQPLRR